MFVSLPEDISPNEKLARTICASSKLARYKRTAFYFDEEQNKYVVRVEVFIDDRPPSLGKELSVNRISTISLDAAHQLGLEHQIKKQQLLTYHGFAELLAQHCFDYKCSVVKDDDNGQKPYHANIVYPSPQSTKEDEQEIAVKLALKANFIKFNNTTVNKNI